MPENKKNEASILDKIIVKLRKLLPADGPNPEPGSGTDRCKVDRVWVTAALELKGKLESLTAAVDKAREKIASELRNKNKQLEDKDLALQEAANAADVYMKKVAKREELMMNVIRDYAGDIFVAYVEDYDWDDDGYQPICRNNFQMTPEAFEQIEKVLDDGPNKAVDRLTRTLAHFDFLEESQKVEAELEEAQATGKEPADVADKADA